MTYSSTKRGYTLLFSVLTASLVLAVAAFIVGVARKQAILVSAARDSLYAMYAADTGISCVVGNWNFSTSNPASVKCKDSTIPFSFTPLQGGDTRPPGFNGVVLSTALSSAPNTVSPVPIVLSSVDPNPKCVQFQIWSGRDINDNPKTVIEARGYNMCDVSGFPLSNPRTAERAIRFTQ